MQGFRKKVCVASASAADMAKWSMGHGDILLAPALGVGVTVIVAGLAMARPDRLARALSLVRGSLDRSRSSLRGSICSVVAFAPQACATWNVAAAWAFVVWGRGQGLAVDNWGMARSRMRLAWCGMPGFELCGVAVGHRAWCMCTCIVYLCERVFSHCLYAVEDVGCSAGQLWQLFPTQHEQ